MKNVVLPTMLAVALLTGGAEAQTSTAAASGPSATGPLYPGQTMKAAQFCSRFPGDGLAVTVMSVAEGGRGATVKVDVKCWGKTWVVTQPFTGSIRADGRATLTFTNGFGYGAELSGTWKMENGKPIFDFGGAKLGFGYSNPPVWTDGAVLQ